MKITKYTIVLCCLLTFNFTFGQAEICTTFERGGFEGWTALNATRSISSPALDGTNYLRAGDGSGSSWVFNRVSYPTNWEQFNGSCLCFDYKIYNDGQANATVNLNPRIFIFNGTNPVTATLLAVFTANITVTENSDWVHLCAPIMPSIGTILPSNADGQWAMTGPSPAPANWNILLTNVSGIAFAVDLGSSFQTEIIGIDNICIQECDTGIPPPTDEGSYCCDSENLVVNGNFEFGNTGFTSSYANNSAVNPGEYDVVTNAGAFGTTVTDHSFCADPVMYANNDLFMVVNGKTQQLGSSVIWEQTISGLELEGQYKFCANFKNMPQCTFDILPTVSLEVTGSGSSGTFTFSTNPTDPCDWLNIGFDFTAFSSTLTFRILLDETGNGDGNDLAIDDISVTKLIDPALSITVQHQGNPQQITASLNTIGTADDILHGTNCQYFWYVAKVLSYPPVIIDFSTFASGNASGNTVGSSPWNLTTTFPDYVFSPNTLYIVGMFTPSCECYEEGNTYQLTFNNLSVNAFISEEQQQQIIDRILTGNDKMMTDPNALPSSSQGLRIHPNPVKQGFNLLLQGDKVKGVEVFSISGQSIFSKEYSGTRNEETIDFSAFASGMYFIKVYGAEEKLYTAKLLKE